MKFEDLLKQRRSVRAFKDRPVEPRMIRSILEAANAAPSAGNLQAYEIVLVTDSAVRAALAHASHQDVVAAAPVSLVFFASPARSRVKYRRRGEQLYCVQDATIACAFAQLRAADLGLGSVWVGSFDDQAVCRAVRAPRGLRPMAVLPIGHPAESPARPPRRSLKSLVRQEKF